MTGATIPLTLPPSATPIEWKRFRRLCTLLSQADPSDNGPDKEALFSQADIPSLYPQPVLAAAANTLVDLWDQGWQVRIVKRKPCLLPPAPNDDRVVEKQRILRQELIARNHQLSRPSVQRFIRDMEKPHLHNGRLVTIFDLMRDGRDLAHALEEDPDASGIIQPYVQIVDGSVCSQTGFRTHDIWRYFRHTWSNAYGTVPGRSMEILIRDAAAPNHPVIGLAALSSAVVQIAERDEWIGWNTGSFLEHIEQSPSDKVAAWLVRRMETQLDEIYTDDLIRDGILEPRDTVNCPQTASGRLRADAERARRNHHAQATLQDIRALERATWEDRAEAFLFRSKRSAALAELLDISCSVRRYLVPHPTAENLQRALGDPQARKHIGRLVRHARGERVGTVIADLTVCGAIAPYNALAAGKLVGALAVSPTVLNAYRDRYNRPSEIASAMAGHDVIREGRLAFIGTTSLYGTGSSQYNRLFWPAEVLSGDKNKRLGFYKLGRSRSFGSSQFTPETVESLVRLAIHQGSTVRVNSVFGEGVSPRLRKVRIGLAALGWPANDLLRHGRERIVYGVPLVNNLLEFCLGIDAEPDYLFKPDFKGSDKAIGDWWTDRWCRMRARNVDVLAKVRANTLVRPVRHGARVILPDGPGSV